jgi:hypothetical protein
MTHTAAIDDLLSDCDDDDELKWPEPPLLCLLCLPSLSVVPLPW